MARINIAYQALRGRTSGLPAGAPEAEPVSAPGAAAPFTRERVDPAASLEQVMAAVARKVDAARQQLIDEIVRDGLPRDTAVNLLRQTLRDSSATSPPAGSPRGGDSGGRLNADTSYDQALAIVRARAEAARNELADALVHDGLQRTAAVELVDSAFESVRRRPGTTAPRGARLSPDHLKQGVSPEQGLQVTTDKLRAALKIVVDELAGDGMPQQTAQQLAQAALDSMATARRR